MKEMVLKLILGLLYRAMRVLERRDASVREDLSQLSDGACVRIRAGLSRKAPQLTVVRKDGQLLKGDENRRADIEIVFKSTDAAVRVFTGCESIGRAYCRHRFVLTGNINETMGLVRAIETAEGYLFPRVWSRRILKRRVDKQLPAVKVYGLAICGRT
ncbi:MAG: hypothetical protein IJO98_01800 [Clostridia bacterium]|nr:hypothetical protein [Clostridia bacterium]